MGRGPFPPICKQVPQPVALGALPAVLCSSITARLLGTLLPCRAWEERARRAGRGLEGRQSFFLCSLLPPEPPYSPPRSPPLLDASWLPVYQEEPEAADFIQAFVSSPEKVTAAISNAAVPASAERGSAAGLPEVCWLGRAASPSPPTWPRTPSALVPLAVCPPSHAPCLSLCSPGCQEGQEMEFLRSVCTLCRTAKQYDILQGLDVFCHSYELAENIKVRAHPAALGKGASLPGAGSL